MIRHILVAAWRNIAANRLLAAISIGGLAVGIATAILMGLVIRNQMSFDHFIPGHAQTYRALFALPPPATCNDRRGCPLDYRMAALLKLNVPDIESVARMVHTNAGPVKLQHANVTAWEMLYWADPDIFDVLPLPVLHGDLKNALRRPDGIVLPRATAQKYFGRADAVGGIVTLDGHPMVVQAVIADLPTNATELQSGIFASGLASFSKIVPASGGGGDAKARNAYLAALVYLRLKPGASVAGVEKQASKWHWSTLSASERAMYEKAGESLDVRLLRLDRINLSEAFNPGIGQRLAITALAASLVLFIAAVNFINLMVARAARREREVGVRKACGATRASLMLQFLSETMIGVALATCLATVASEWLLPAMNDFLQTGARLDDVTDPASLPFLLACIVILGLAAGAYPAFVLSAFKPASVLRGWGVANTGAIRDLLVTLQFAILIVLAVSAGVIWEQRNYATREALRVNTDQMLLVRTVAGPGLIADMTSPLACPAGFRDEVRKLPGVSGAVCSGLSFLAGNVVTSWPRRDGSEDDMGATQVDAGLFALYGIKAVAGSLPTYPNATAATMGVTLNVAAVRKLGFASPQAAIGHSWLPSSVMPAADFSSVSKQWGSHAIITAVVPDFAFTSVKQRVTPALFSPWTYEGRSRLIHIKLSGRQIPETLAAIDRLWLTTNQPGPLDRFFLNDYMQQIYRDMTRQAQLFSAFTAIAIVLACLGLIGIAVSTAERRTKEIGIRKAMGAGEGQIVTLLLWQFAKPVLWANVIAWPLAFLAMRRWLSGFAYHVDLHWWMFAVTSLGALLIALVTVAGQAWLAARRKPVLALRYE